MTEMPLFHQSFWMDLVAPGEWGCVKVEKNNDIIAYMPFIERQRYGLNVLGMPQCTPFSGPYIAPLEGKPYRKISTLFNLMNELIGKLPKHDIFRQNFSTEIENIYPFYLSGYEASPRYTYQLHNIDETENLEANLPAKTRSLIKKAKKNLKVSSDISIGQFIDLHDLTYIQQNEPVRYTHEFMERVICSCLDGGIGKLFGAFNKDGRLHAANFTVKSGNTVYYLMAASDVKYRNSGAPALLVWEVIRAWKKECKVFDFEGSMIPGIERFFRGFGAQPKQYLAVKGYFGIKGRAVQRIEKLRGG